MDERYEIYLEVCGVLDELSVIDVFDSLPKVDYSKCSFDAFSDQSDIALIVMNEYLSNTTANGYVDSIDFEKMLDE